MKYARIPVIIFVVVAVVVLATACGGRRGGNNAATDTPAPAVEEAATEASATEAEAEATVEEAATEAPEAEATAAEAVEEAATEVPEAEATAESGAEAAVEEAATEVPEADATVEGEAEATVEGAATQASEAVATAAATPEAMAAAADAKKLVVDEMKAQVDVMVNPPLQVASEASIADVIDNNNPSLVTLSTSGQRLTWPQTEGRLWKREGELCLYTFETAASDCYVAPDTYEGYPYAFFWAPDDKYIAFTEDPVKQGYESDIWVFDTATNDYVDLTDDGVEGGWVSAEPGTFQLDYLPMWNAEDGHIYFWRSIPNPEMPISITLSIMKIAPEGGEPEVVRELQDQMGGNLILFEESAWFMDGPSALSPDGRQVAVVVTSEDESETAEDDSNGLWIVDLDDTNAPPRQLATADDFNSANMEWIGTPLTPIGLSWVADGKHVVVLAQNNDPQIPLIVLYYVDVESGEMTPVVDFSNITGNEEYMGQPDDEGIPPRFYSPWTATMSPDNKDILMYQNLANAAGLMIAPLPPNGELPGMLYQSELENSAPTARSSRSQDGKVLIYNVLFNTTRE